MKALLLLLIWQMISKPIQTIFRCGPLSYHDIMISWYQSTWYHVDCSGHNLTDSEIIFILEVWFRSCCVHPHHILTDPPKRLLPTKSLQGLFRLLPFQLNPAFLLSHCQCWQALLDPRSSSLLVPSAARQLLIVTDQRWLLTADLWIADLLAGLGFLRRRLDPSGNPNFKLANEKHKLVHSGAHHVAQ